MDHAKLAKMQQSVRIGEYTRVHDYTPKSRLS
jgi:hypothetical protein